MGETCSNGREYNSAAKWLCKQLSDWTKQPIYRIVPGNFIDRKTALAGQAAAPQAARFQPYLPSSGSFQA
jgi:hypothetical protein